MTCKWELVVSLKSDCWMTFSLVEWMRSQQCDWMFQLFRHSAGEVMAYKLLVYGYLNNCFGYFYYIYLEIVIVAFSFLNEVKRILLVMFGKVHLCGGGCCGGCMKWISCSRNFEIVANGRDWMHTIGCLWDNWSGIRGEFWEIYMLK